MGGVTAAKAVKLVEEAHPRAAMTPYANALLQHGRDGKPAQARSLGHIIKGMKGNTIGGMRFVEAGKEHSAVLWKVEVAASAIPAGEFGENGEVAFPPMRGSSTPHTDVMMCEKTRNGSQQGGEELPPFSPNSPGGAQL